MYADASEDTMWAVAYLSSQTKGYSADIAFVIATRSGTDEASFNTSIGIVVWLKEQIVKEHEMKKNSCSLWSNSTTVLQWIHTSHRKQQVFLANRVDEILETTDVSQ